MVYFDLCKPVSSVGLHCPFFGRLSKAAFFESLVTEGNQIKTPNISKGWSLKAHEGHAPLDPAFAEVL